MIHKCQCGRVKATNGGFRWCGHCDVPQEKGHECFSCIELRKTEGRGPRS